MKVACTKCRAAFDVDERNVPPTGKMVRCTECQNAFIWRPPNASSALGAPGSVFDFGGDDRITPTGAEPGSGAALKAPPGPGPGLPSLDDELSLPPAPKRPAGVGRPAPPPPPPPRAPAAGAEVSDLPAPRGRPPAPPTRPVSSTVSDIPAPGPRATPPGFRVERDEITPPPGPLPGRIPSPTPSADAGWSDDEVDLPAPARPGRAPAPLPPRGDDVPDLLAPAGLPRRPIVPAAGPVAEPDLPVPVAARRDAGSDLPVPVRSTAPTGPDLLTPIDSPLPTPRSPSDLPAPAGAPLPTPAGAPLPTPAGAPLPTPARPGAPEFRMRPPPPPLPPRPVRPTGVAEPGSAPPSPSGFAPPGAPGLPDLPPLDSLPDLDSNLAGFPPPPVAPSAVTMDAAPEPNDAFAPPPLAFPAAPSTSDADHESVQLAEAVPSREGAPGEAVVPAPAAAPVRSRARRKGKLRIGRVVAFGGIVLFIVGAGLAGLASFTNLFGGRDKNRLAFEGARLALGEDQLASYRRVITQMEALIEKNPKDREARALEAQAHLALGFAGVAAEGQTGQSHAEDLGPITPADSPDVIKARALRSLLSNGAPDAIRWLMPLTAAHPTDGLAWVYLGWAFARDGKTEEAQKAFRSALSAPVPPQSARYGLARSLEASGKKIEALAEYRRLLKPPPGRLGAAVAVERLGDADPADAEKRVLELAAKADPKRAAPLELAEAWTWLGQRAQAAGRNGEAEDRFKKALSLDATGVLAKVGLARLLCESEHLAQALPMLDDVLKRQPKNIEALYTMVQAQIQNQHADAAGPFLRTAAALAPKDARTFFWHGRIEEAEAKSGFEERAAKDYQAAIEADPLFIDGYVMLSNLWRLTDPEKARATLAKAEEKAAADPPLHNKLGEVYLALGDATRAEEYFRKVIEKAPSYHKARMNLAAALELGTKYDEADAVLAELEKLQKDYPGLAERRASLAVKRLHYEDAAQLYDQALAQTQPRAGLLVAAGNVNFHLGNYDKAKKLFTDAVVDDLRSGPAHLGLARVGLAAGHGEEASYESKRSLSGAETGEAHLVAGQASEMLGRSDLAREDYAAATKFPTTEFDARMGMARLLAHSGAVQDALKELEKVIVLDHTRSEPYVLTGDCYEELSKPDDARRAYEMAVKQDSKNGEAAFKLGRNLKDAGKRGVAADLLERAARLGGEQRYVSEALVLAGDARRAGKQNSEALKDYKQFLEVAPKAAPERADVEREVARLEGRH